MPVKALFISIFRCQKRQDMPRTSCLSPVLPRLHVRKNSSIEITPAHTRSASSSRMVRIPVSSPHNPRSPTPAGFRSHPSLQFPVHHKYLMNRSFSLCILYSDRIHIRVRALLSGSFFLNNFCSSSVSSPPSPHSADIPFSPVSVPPCRINCPP